jgi:hypothetical protein
MNWRLTKANDCGCGGSGDQVSPTPVTWMTRCPCRTIRNAISHNIIRRAALDRVDKTPVAFTLDDIAFFKGKKRITHTVLAKCASIKEAVELLNTVTLTWTTQKNGIWGEQIRTKKLLVSGLVPHLPICSHCLTFH